MFRRQPDVTKTDTLIGEGTTFEGQINTQASIRIEGRVMGDITCKGDVTIGEKALIESNISARNITIAGEVRGDVSATGRLAITSSGRLIGDAVAAALIIEEGGRFSGTSRMAETETTSKTSRRTQDESTSETQAL